MKMQKIIATVFAVAMALLVQAGTASAFASSGYGFTGPGAPVVDPSVRVGGFAPSMSPYFVNLRGGIVTHPRQDFGLRTAISQNFYPRQRIEHFAPARTGGRFIDRGFLRGSNLRGDFVFDGRTGSRFGSGTVTGLY